MTEKSVSRDKPNSTVNANIEIVTEKKNEDESAIEENNDGVTILGSRRSMPRDVSINIESELNYESIDKTQVDRNKTNNLVKANLKTKELLASVEKIKGRRENNEVIYNFTFAEDEDEDEIEKNVVYDVIED